MRQIIKADEQKRLLSWLKQQGATQRRPLLLLSLLALAAFILQLLIFWQLAKVAQYLIVDQLPLTSEQLIGLGMTLLALLIVERLRLWGSERLESRLFGELQATFFEKLSSGQHALIRQHSTYFWQQVWLSHLPVVAQFNVQYLVQQRFAMAVPIIVLVCTFAINWLVGLSLLISLPVVPLFMILVGKGAAKLHRRHFKALSRLGSIFVDRIKALELIKIFNIHDEQSAILASASDNLNERTMHVVGVAFLSASVLDFFSTLAVALVAVFVGFNLLGEFTLGGQLSLHTGLFLLLTAPLCFAELKQLGKLYHLRAEAIAVAETLSPIFTTPENPDRKIVDANTFTAIDWGNFSVATPAIQVASLYVEKGDWIWLQGDSGSGKTCFMESLMGQRQSSHALAHAALISQQAVILPASIRDNLCLGVKSDDDTLRSLLQKVELDDWLARQTDGLDTILDEQIPLSGGQKQRLALARVLLSNAQVVLLDEPTAHLTTEQHQRLSQMIKQALADRTVIWASHKPLDRTWFNRTWTMVDGVLST